MRNSIFQLMIHTLDPLSDGNVPLSDGNTFTNMHTYWPIL